MIGADSGIFQHNRFVPNLRQETERFLTAWLAVRQIVQAANFNRFHQAGVSATQFMILNVIPSAGLSLSELARKLNLSPATLNETVNSLLARKLVERRPDSHDRRKVRIVATVDGQALQNSTSEDFHKAMGVLFGRMSAKGRRALLEGLEEFAALHVAE